MIRSFLICLTVCFTVSFCFALSAPSDVRVAPLVSTTWGQTTEGGNSCFNYYTPGASGYTTSGSASNYPTGCVATAMGQVIYYHQYGKPDTGIFGFNKSSFPVTYFNSSTTVNTSVAMMYGTISNPGGTNFYDWGLMASISSSVLARQEVGRLMHDLGAGLSMNYYPWSIGSIWYGGSYTDFDFIDDTFDGFSYTNAKTIEGNYLSGGNLTAQTIPVAMAELAITTNLDAGLPVIIGVNDTSLNVGHALVIDGYGVDSSGRTIFHYNFGLPVLGVTAPATNTGWFTLPGVGTTNDSAGYSVLDGIAFNTFKPAAPVLTPTGEIISGRITDASGNPLAGIAIDIQAVNAGYLFTRIFTNSAGIYASYGTVTPNQAYTVTASDPLYISQTQTCNVGVSNKYWSGTSTNGVYVNSVGNVRADMSLTAAIPLPVLPICDLNELAGFAKYWNTYHSSLTAPGTRYDYNGDWNVNLGDLRRIAQAWLTNPVEFRTEAMIPLDVPGTMPVNMPWQYSGAAWSVVAAPIVAAESPVITHNQSTSFKLPIKMYPGNGTVDIIFDFACDTEPMADVFEFLVDGAVQTEMGGQSAFSGNMGHIFLNYQLTNVHLPQLKTLEFRYTKNGANSVGADRVWVGNITINMHP